MEYEEEDDDSDSEEDTDEEYEYSDEEEPDHRVLIIYILLTNSLTSSLTRVTEQEEMNTESEGTQVEGRETAPAASEEQPAEAVTPAAAEGSQNAETQATTST